MNCVLNRHCWNFFLKIIVYINQKLKRYWQNINKHIKKIELDIEEKKIEWNDSFQSKQIWLGTNEFVKRNYLEGFLLLYKPRPLDWNQRVKFVFYIYIRLLFTTQYNFMINSLVQRNMYGRWNSSMFLNRAFMIFTELIQINSSCSTQHYDHV